MWPPNGPARRPDDVTLSVVCSEPPFPAPSNIALLVVVVVADYDLESGARIALRFRDGLLIGLGSPSSPEVVVHILHTLTVPNGRTLRGTHLFQLPGAVFDCDCDYLKRL